MAEIGLIASIFSVAAFGTSVATTLYQTGDIMINADQQIYALAKHVSQSTAVLKHMGEVLETEKANCSKELLRDIRKIKHSCKRTFKEIKATAKSKRFRFLGSVRWLFKRTKAMELEARLDSQQSMLQCIIHTLSVSKLGRMDSRSKEDSEHIVGLKVEINLLKTFIMENYNNLVELRRAEQLMEAEKQYQSMSGDDIHPPTHDPYGNGNIIMPNQRGRSSLHESRIVRSSSTASRTSKSENEGSNSDDEANDDEDNSDDDENDSGDDDNDDEDDKATDGSHEFKIQNDRHGTKSMANASNEDGLVPKFSFRPQSFLPDGSGSATRPESSLLLQMVPYRPRPLQMNSDRLIHYKQDLHDDNKHLSQGATESVRLLLDKWTNSGSVPVSNILHEEIVKEKLEFELAKQQEISDSRYDQYRQSTFPEVEAIDDYDDPYYGYRSDSRGFHTPPPPPLSGRRPRRLYPDEAYGFNQKDFWRSHEINFLPPNAQLGVAMLSSLRSTRGGIYYIKSNAFKQVHYVDHHVVYRCQLVPSELIPDSEWKYVNTEVDKGLIRAEALDLLGYSYAETATGKYSISGDLELSEIEELVHFSYRALDKHLKARSKAIIEERGWIHAVRGLNRLEPGVYANVPNAVPRPPSPMPPTFPYQNRPLRGQRPGLRSPLPAGAVDSGRRALSEAHRPDLHTSVLPFVGQHTAPIVKNIGLEIPEAPKVTRPEVRFTLPHANLTSSTADSPNGAQKSSAKPNVPQLKTNDEYLKLVKKLEHLEEKREAAVQAGDHSTAADIKYYAIPDLEAQIKKMQKQQDKEKEKETKTKKDEPGRASQVKKEKNNRRRSYHTEVETESEHEGEEDGSKTTKDLYDDADGDSKDLEDLYD